jgi:hypothetical protein
MRHRKVFAVELKRQIIEEILEPIGDGPIGDVLQNINSASFTYQLII